MTPWLQDDLEWFTVILAAGRLAGIPTAMFGQLPPPDVHVYMDASDSGLCALDPAGQRFILLQFDTEERNWISLGGHQFDINIREHFALTLACLLFGPLWFATTPVKWLHVRCWSDNTTTVARTRKLSARHRWAQNLNRCIGLAEAVFQLRVSAAHIPGAQNLAADTGSRQTNRRHQATFTNLTVGWQQVQVPAHLRKIYSNFSNVFSPSHWPPALDSSTRARGGNGATGVSESINPCNSLDQQTNSLTNSRCLRSRVGPAPRPPTPTRPPPCCPRSAMLHGIIGCTTGTMCNSQANTSWLCKGCDGCRLHPRGGPQSQPASCGNCEPASTSIDPATASSGGLRSWASSSCSVDRSTSRSTGRNNGS